MKFDAIQRIDQPQTGAQSNICQNASNYSLHQPTTNLQARFWSARSFMGPKLPWKPRVYNIVRNVDLLPSEPVYLEILFYYLLLDRNRGSES